MNGTPRLCLVEDDQIMGESLVHRFNLENIPCDWYQDADSALDALETSTYAVLISDIRLPDMTGEELVNALHTRNITCPPIIFITGYGSIDQAVRVLQTGARDYITKPFELDELLDKLRNIAPSLYSDADDGLGTELGISPAMRGIQSTLNRLAKHDADILITGESGVGKERATRYLHGREKDAEKRPFVAINCAAISESLLESELFGYDKGAFTGANQTHRGVFEQADGGTLFLDEVGNMPASMQAKVLRVIQDYKVQRIGSERTIQTKVRLICATNRDLKSMVKSGDFREDLYYRVNVLHVHIPPLRERKEDIIWFARHFTEEYAAKNGERRHLLPAAEKYLLQQSWPGNIRELSHAIERACIFSQRDVLGAEELQADLSTQAETDDDRESSQDLKSHLRQREEEVIRNALDTNEWRINETSAQLGISRKNLWEKMRRYEISAE